jgi:hypothetical protein
MQTRGINLLEQAFEQMTGELMTAFRLKKGIQHMDSTFVTSNIREWDRMQLIVVVLQRVHRVLSEKDQVSYTDPFEPYVKESIRHYTYRLKKVDFFPHLERIGACFSSLLPWRLLLKTVLFPPYPGRVPA